MKNEGDLIYNVREDFSLHIEPDSFFFHTKEFLSLNPSSVLNFILSNKSGKELAKIYFHVEKNAAKSQLRSSFGSFDMGPDLETKSLIYFTDYIIQYFIKIGIRKISIVSFPECYDHSKFYLVHNALTHSGFKINKPEITQYLEVGDSFREKVSASERRYLNKANKNLVFKKLDINSLPHMYQLIKECRVEKGYPVTMTYEQLYQAVKQLPKRYLLFGLFEEETLIAGSVSIKVNNRVLYDFYHGDDLKYRKFSPVVALIQGIYNYAREYNYEILDLGVSTEQGIKNEGIYKFKKALGALDSEKVIFERVI